jgi:Fe-S cluster biogenesis protein NfuA
MTSEESKEAVSFKEKVRRVIEEEIRPALQMDGGNIALVDVDEETGIVKVQLLGACAGCPMSMVTLTMFVEQQLKQKVPGVKRVVPV